MWYFYLGLTDQLGADPQNTLERALGLWALRFLILALAITPLRRLGGPSLIRYRRAIGLLAFYYAALHLTVYMVLDQGLDFAAIWADIVKRPYITVGMLAFTLLVPLAVTSNSAMIRRLGGAAWQRLHRLVYVAAAAAAIHFLMLVKSWTFEPLFYAPPSPCCCCSGLASTLQKRLWPKHASRPTARARAAARGTALTPSSSRRRKRAKRARDRTDPCSDRPSVRLCATIAAPH